MPVISSPIRSPIRSPIYSPLTGKYGNVFTPLSLFTGGVGGAFLDLTDTTTLFQDMAGTSPVTAAGQRVGKWRDKSGNNNHFVALADDTSRPTYNIDADGFPYLQFSGAQALYCANGSLLYSASGLATACIAAKGERPATASVLYAEGNSASTTAFYMLFSVSNSSGIDKMKLSFRMRSNASTLQEVLGTEYAFDGDVRILSNTDNARTATIRVGGRSAGSLTYAGTLTINRSSIGSLPRTSQDSFFTGRVYGGFFGIKKVLSAADLASVEAWMAAASRTSRRSTPGAWTFFTDPRALAVGGRQVVGSLIDTGSAGGIATLTDISDKTRFGAKSYPLVRYSVSDDHNNPTAIVRASDSRVVALYTGHTATDYFTAVSTNPLDISAFGAQQSLDTQYGLDEYTYANPIQITSESGMPIFNFFRARSLDTLSQSLHYSKILDNGSTTWAAGVQITTGYRPYFRMSKNAFTPNRIDFCTNDAHPSDAATNATYHFYMLSVGGVETFYKSDGTSLTLPITPATALTPIWPGTPYRSWVWDIATDANGYPIIVYAVFPDTATDHRYRYARWTGSAWVDNEICSAGGSLYGVSGEEIYYSGGVALDHNDPTVIYCSRQISGVFQIFRMVTADGGATWSSTQLTTGTEYCFRPVLVRDQVTEPRLAYVRATRYTAYTDYDAQIMLVNSLTGQA